MRMRIIVSLLPLLLTACSTLQIGIEPTPSAMGVAVTATPTATSAPVASVTAPAATEVTSSSTLVLAHGESIQSMQLLTPQQGWALADRRLLWTDDGGIQWREVTPPQVARLIEAHVSSIKGVFFRDAMHGWVVVSGPPDADESTPLDVWRTTDGAQTWQPASLAPASPDFATALSSAAFVSALDDQHVWIVVQLASSSNFSVGELFQSTDGGAAWTQFPAPLGEPVHFANPSLGWIAGGPAGNQLFVTRDGGLNWQPQVLAVDGGQPSFVAPTFSNDTEGVLPVTLGDGQGVTGVGFYVTHDEGQTWELAAVLANPNPEALGLGVKIPTDIVDTNTWVVALSDGALYATPDGGKTWRAGITAGLPAGVSRLDFVSDSTGWALASFGACAGFKTDCATYTQMLATTDGGQTWTLLLAGQTPMP